MTQADFSIVSIAERPDLVCVASGWIWEAFDREAGLTLEETRRMVAASCVRSGTPQTFVLLLEGESVGTASLVADDCPERPDLTPWLASVFVLPEARGKGVASRLVGAVEAAARASHLSTLWLYTHTAEHIYARAGWEWVEYFDRGGHRSALMRRDLVVRHRPIDKTG